MQCPRCGAELSGQYDVCAYCGKKLPKKLLNGKTGGRSFAPPAAAQDAPKDKRSGKWVLIVIAAVLAAALIAGGSFAAVTFTSESYRYGKAVRYMESGNYAKADALFGELSGYGDAATLRKENRYLWAQDLMEKEDYDAAYDCLRQLGNYKDARSLIRRSKYDRALTLMDGGDYDAALDLLTEIDPYENSAALMERCRAALRGEPVTEAPEPTTKAPEPTTKAPEPTTKAPEPATKAPEPTTKAPEPVTEPPRSDGIHTRADGDPIPTSPGRYVTYTEGEHLRIRIEPSTSAIVLNQLADGTYVDVLEVVRNSEGEYWGRITYTSRYGSVSGYVSMEFLFPAQ